MRTCCAARRTCSRAAASSRWPSPWSSCSSSTTRRTTCDRRREASTTANRCHRRRRRPSAAAEVAVPAVDQRVRARHRFRRWQVVPDRSWDRPPPDLREALGTDWSRWVLTSRRTTRFGGFKDRFFLSCNEKKRWRANGGGNFSTRSATRTSSDIRQPKNYYYSV